MLWLMVSNKEMFPRSLLSLLESALLFIIWSNAWRITDFVAATGSCNDPRKLAVVCSGNMVNNKIKKMVDFVMMFVLVEKKNERCLVGDVDFLVALMVVKSRGGNIMRISGKSLIWNPRPRFSPSIIITSNNRRNSEICFHWFAISKGIVIPIPYWNNNRFCATRIEDEKAIPRLLNSPAYGSKQRIAIQLLTLELLRNRRSVLKLQQTLPLWVNF